MNCSEQVSNVNEFISAIGRIYDGWNESGKQGCNKFLFFRGHYSEQWELIPSVLRNGIYDEKEISLDFKQVCPMHTSDFHPIDDINKMLVEMQHYELPTRLLDWTISPLVALFFACYAETPSQDEQKADAIVWVLNPWKVYKYFIEQNQTLSGKTLPSCYMDINIVARSLLAYKWTAGEIAQYIQDKFHYSIDLVEYQSALPYIAKYRNDRIVAQRRAFTIFGEQTCALNFQSGYKNSSNLQCIKILEEHKKPILDELNKLCINEYTIYPDYVGMNKMIRSRRGLFNI